MFCCEERLPVPGHVLTHRTSVVSSQYEKKNYFDNKTEQLLAKTLTWLHKKQGIEKAAAD